MRHARRIQIITTTCRRCNKPIATGNRSLWGADELKQKYDRICEQCITDDERHAIEQGLASAILGHNVTIPNTQEQSKMTATYRGYTYNITSERTRGTEGHGSWAYIYTANIYKEKQLIDSVTAQYESTAEKRAQDRIDEHKQAAQDKPRNTISVLCKRDLHRECDDATYCACGCHLKPAIYAR